MKNLKSFILLGLVISFLGTLIYTLNLNYSKFDYANSASSHGARTHVRNYEKNPIVNNSNWNTHLVSHVKMRQQTTHYGIRRLKSLKTSKKSSLLSVKSSTLGGSNETLLMYDKRSMFIGQSGQNSVSISSNYTPENICFQSKVDKSQLIAHNTFDIPMQFAGPPSGGGLGILDDPAMPLEGEFFCFIILLLCFVVYKVSLNLE